MRIKHLLLILLFISINVVFIPIYEYGYKIGTWDPDILDDYFNKTYVFWFIVYLVLILFTLIFGFFIYCIEYNGFKKIDKFLNKKIL